MFQSLIFNDTSVYYLTLEEIEAGAVQKIMSSGMQEHGYKLVARNIATGYRDKHNKDIYENDTLKISGSDYYSNASVSFDNDWSFTGIVKYNSYMFLVLAEDKTWIPFYDFLQNEFEIEVITIEKTNS
jgi:hypothetical protein